MNKYKDREPSRRPRDDWIEPLGVEKSKWLIKYAVDFKIIVFRDSYRKILRECYGDDGLKMIEAAISSVHLHDANEFSARIKAVRRLARREGVKIHSIGKRPKAELEALVEELAPIFLFLGVPLGSGTNSKLPLALADIAQQLGVEGDPRTELRRIKRLRIRLDRFVYELVLKAAIEGARPDGE